jgi:hypothetical protein
MKNPEYRQKLSLALKGKVKTPEHLEKLRLSLINSYATGKSVVSEERRQAVSAANTGRKASPETLKKLSDFQSQRFANGAVSTFDQPEYKATQSARIKKLWDNPEYRKHMSTVHRLACQNLMLALRSHYQYRIWRDSVFERDGYICQECGVKGGRLAGHHKVAFSKLIRKAHIHNLEEGINCPSLWDVDNGITLCVPCHRKTDNYGSEQAYMLVEAA